MIRTVPVPLYTLADVVRLGGRVFTAKLTTDEMGRQVVQWRDPDGRRV